MLEKILQYNTCFVENKDYETYISSKYPDKKVAIISCMDTRLTELLPAALGLKNGDATIIKNDCGVISHPFVRVMRSLMIAIYELNVQEILVIGHSDCGARRTESKKMIEKMNARGISQKDIDMMDYFGIDFDAWLSGFEDLDRSVNASVDLIRKHPLIPEDVTVHGLVIDSLTGALRTVTPFDETALHR